MNKLKPILSIIGLVALSMMMACSGNNASQDLPESGTETSTAAPDKKEFDLKNVPVSTADLGEFPYVQLPEGIKEQNPPVSRKIDQLYFPINGEMIKLEGRVWKTNVVNTQENKDDWSSLYFEKSCEDSILAKGGVKIFEGNISEAAYNDYKNQATYLGEDGSIGYPSQLIKVYLIRRPNEDDIYIQLTANTASGYINVLQKDPASPMPS